MSSTPVVSRVITKEELCLLEKVPESCGIIIFGASGDLTHRKLMPSLFTLVLENVLPKQLYILGVARSALSDATFQARIREALGGAGTPAQRDEFIRRCLYLSGDYQDVQTYITLKQKLAGLDEVYETQGRHLFYLSTPPTLYEPVIEQLGSSGLSEWLPASAEATAGTRRSLAKAGGFASS